MMMGAKDGHRLPLALTLCCTSLMFLVLFVVRGVYDGHLSDNRARDQSKQNSNGLYHTASTVRDHEFLGPKDNTVAMGGREGKRGSPLHAAYKQYINFYLQKSLAPNRTQLLKTLYNDFVSDEQRSADKRTPKERQHMLKDFPHQIQLLERLWSILNHGRLPNSESHSPAVEENSNHHGSLKDMLCEGSMIEIGNGATALKLATQFPKLTVMAVISSGQQVQSFFAGASLNGVYNYYEGRLKDLDLISAVGQLYRDHSVLFSNLLLSDLVSLRGKLLPHEFEELVGRMLTLSSQTFVADIKTSNPRDVQYFKHNWQSMSSLLQASCHMAGIKCKIDLISGDSGWNEGRGLHRVTVNIGVRYLPVALCHRLRPTAQWCQLTYNSYADNVTVRFSDGSRKMSPASLIGISLHTMLHLGVIQENVDQIFKQLLHMPYKRLNTRQFLLTGGYLSTYTPGEGEVSVDSDDNTRPLFMKVKELLVSPSMQRRLLGEVWPKQNDMKMGHYEEKLKEETLTNESEARGATQDTADCVDGSEEGEGEPGAHTQPHFGPADGDEDQYDMEWNTLKSHFYLAAKQKDGYFSLLTYGGKTQGLLGSKVAHLFSNASVVSILPYRHYKQSDKLRELTESLGLHNLLVFVTDLTPLKVTKLRAMPHITHFQMLGLDTWRSLSSFGAVFPVYLGQLLSLAQTTFLEIPKPEQLVLAYLMTHSTSQAHTQLNFKGLIHEALATAGLEADLEVVDTNQDDRGIDTVVKLLRVSLKYAERKVRLDCQGTQGLLTLTSGGQVYVKQSGSYRQLPLARAGEAFNLDVLLELDPEMVPTVRAQLFEEYLHLKRHADMCPKNIVWFNSTLTYSDMIHSTATLQAEQNTEKHTNSQSVLEILLAEFDATKPFSFLDYDSSNAHVLLSLAQRYPNHTIIAIIQEHAQADALYEAMTTKNITNIAVCNVKLEEAFVQKLRNSPDFLRYQYLSLQRWLDAVKSMSRVKFNFMMGDILATGVTTFVQLPSAQMLSLAMVTFFPEAFHGRVRRRQDRETYLLHNHPWTLYDRAEFKLLGEAAHADVSIEVRGEVIQARQTSNDTWQPWSILRMDTTNLSLTVDHHFDYLQDGFTRKYQLHCISANKTQYEVYLVRFRDGVKIPYGPVYAFSLVALLRMGLLEPQGQHLYHRFVHLPYYEDMAPWNIVLKGSELDYIDSDTKDFTFDKLVPTAFQVMTVLRNYGRTVKEFGQCKPSANILYGIELIGDCVGSQYEGPCEDTQFPVPCADHTCRRTYLECLRVLSDLELQKLHTHQTHEKFKHQQQQGSFIPVEKPLPYFSGRWRFGPSGAETAPQPSFGHGQK